MKRLHWIVIGVLAVVIILGGIVVLSQPVKADGGGGLSLNLSTVEIKDLACTLFSRGCPVPELEVKEPTFGAFPGPDIFESRLNFNGVPYNFHGRSFEVATGTVVAIQSPAASSTLAYTVDVRVATATATIIEVATSTNAYATTSGNGLIGSLTLASGARGTLIGTSTRYCFIGGSSCQYNVGNGLATTTFSDFARLSDVVIPPSTWVVVKVGAEYGSTDVRANTVKVIFKEI